MDKHQAQLHVSKLGKTFNTRSGSFEALRDVELSVGKGEFVSIIGHSGCGKSTLLNLIAGLEEPTLGGVLLEGELVQGPGPERAVVFRTTRCFHGFRSTRMFAWRSTRSLRAGKAPSNAMSGRAKCCRSSTWTTPRTSVLLKYPVA